jgi:hypothetical protein
MMRERSITIHSAFFFVCQVVFALFVFFPRVFALALTWPRKGKQVEVDGKEIVLVIMDTAGQVRRILVWCCFFVSVFFVLSR